MRKEFALKALYEAVKREGLSTRMMNHYALPLNPKPLRALTSLTLKGERTILKKALGASPLKGPLFEGSFGPRM